MEKIEYREFRRQVANGTITDLKPYIPVSGRIREYIASTGQHVEELYQYNETGVFVAFIENGHASEYYETFKHFRDKRVREALAKRGFWPEEFINDGHQDVRAATAIAHPEYMRRLQRSIPEWNAVKKIVESDPNVTLDDLNFFLSLPARTKGGTYEGMRDVESLLVEGQDDQEPNGTRFAYKQKARAMKYSPSLVEKTMAPHELYKIGSPAWVDGLSIGQIINLYAYRKQAMDNNKLDTFDQHFDQILAHAHSFWDGITFLESIGVLV